MTDEDGREMIFIPGSQWENYMYHPLNVWDANSILYKARILDYTFFMGGERIVMLLETDECDYRMLLIEPEVGEHDNVPKLVYKIADVFKDRLPGHPFLYAEDVRNGKTGNVQRDMLFKKLLEEGD